MKHSRLNEAAVVERLIEAKPDIVRYFVDIGAGDGTTWSNTYDLLLSGWSGLSIECDEIKLLKLNEIYARYPAASVLQTKATPDNITSLLQAVSPAPGFLSLDIDGYDYHVLKALLATHQPQIICLETNMCVPPPYKFSVNYDPSYWWASDAFFGMSAAAAHELLVPYGYGTVEVCYDNIVFAKHGFSATPFADLWRVGYLDAIDPSLGAEAYGQSVCRRLLTLSPTDAISAINSMYGNYAGKFTVWL